MALPLMPILAGIGALTGGVQGYRQSGGDLGSTALGALTGGTLTGGIGKLGQRMAGGLLGKTALGKMAPGLAAQGNPLGVAVTAAPALAGLGAAGLVGVPLSAALAGPTGTAGAKLTGQAAKAAAGATGLGMQATGVGMPDLPGVPGYGGSQFTPTDLGQYGAPNAIQYADPTGSIQSQLRFENQQYLQSLQNALRYAPYQESYQQRSKEADLIRGAKAAQLSTALATDAAMRQQGQLGAQRMAEGFLGNIGQAGAQQYRYF